MKPFNYDRSHSRSHAFVVYQTCGFNRMMKDFLVSLVRVGNTAMMSYAIGRAMMMLSTKKLKKVSITLTIISVLK